MFAKIRSLKITCLPLKKKNAFPPIFGVFVLEVNEILQATPPKLRRKMGMLGQRSDYNIRTNNIYGYSLYVLQSRASRSRCSIPGTWYTVHASTRLQNQRYGGLFCA